MKSDSSIGFWRRLLLFTFLLVLFSAFVNRLLYVSRLEEAKSQIIFESLQNHKILSNELHSTFYGVLDDFNFFQKKVLQLMELKPTSRDYKNGVKALIEFLETHNGYFKVRLTSSSGQELLKFVQRPNHLSYYQSFELFNLANQSFYQDLSLVQGEEFYFSSMEPNIINGIQEVPLRPTVRVSKRVTLANGEEGLLIFNFNGEKILELFSASGIIDRTSSETSLLDSEGFYVASQPRLSNIDYSQLRTSFKKSSPEVFKILKRQESLQGSIPLDNGIVVYSKLFLPNTSERWFLISKFKDANWKKNIHRELLTWIFWEILFLALALTWFWKDEKKRHKDEVVKVLLKERSEFIQNVSHQLKTPLSIMINSLNSKTPAEKDWFDLKKEMHHLIKVVEDMLLLAQVDSLQKLPLKHEDLLEIVSEAVDMTGPKAKEKGISISFNVDENLLAYYDHIELPVMGDLLKSALLNLIDNAIDFSPPQGVVKVFVARVDGRFVIRVEDSGPGIPDAFIPKLFKRFSRHDGSKRKGSGLGLSISKKIIELHGGDLVLAKHQGGTIFEIRL
jgi:signal transduction histidine kinase